MNTLFLRVSDEYIERLMATPSRQVAQRLVTAWGKQNSVKNLSSESYQWAVESKYLYYSTPLSLIPASKLEKYFFIKLYDESTSRS